MSHYYPEDEKSLYYVEFERGDKKGEFTVFKRQWLYSEKELAELKEKSPKDFPMLRMCNEVHPWNIFTAGYGPPGSMPDENWVKFMVDALNLKADTDKYFEKFKKTEGDLTYKMTPMQTDGGGIKLVNETELFDFPFDGDPT